LATNPGRPEHPKYGRAPSSAKRAMTVCYAKRGLLTGKTTDEQSLPPGLRQRNCFLGARPHQLRGSSTTQIDGGRWRPPRPRHRSDLDFPVLSPNGLSSCGALGGPHIDGRRVHLGFPAPTSPTTWSSRTPSRCSTAFRQAIRDAPGRVRKHGPRRPVGTKSVMGDFARPLPGKKPCWRSGRLRDRSCPEAAGRPYLTTVSLATSL